MSADQLFSREEVLGGLPAGRARSLLFLIESQTGKQVAQSRQLAEPFLTERAAEERELAFVEAFALGRDPPLKPTVQDLERHGEEWAGLVPANPRLQAALAYQLGQKYSLVYPAVPGIRQALGLDIASVQEAFTRGYKQPLESIYVQQLGWLERLRWTWTGLARFLENMPPFWTAFSMTLTETVGASILALPIALAQVGPLAGLALLVGFGLVNVLTIVYISEALTRTGSVRFGNAFLGRVVSEYLGSAGASIFSVALVVINTLALVAYYVGIGNTLESATHLPAAMWVAMVFLVGLYFVRRESLNATLATALIVGAANIGLILILSGLALPGVRMENLTYLNLPWVAGRPFQPGLVALVFGVILTSYFGHTSIANCARVVLQRDPSGRGLIRGSAAAQLAVILLYSFWLLAVNGSISPAQLAGQRGTALVPLAEQVGSKVYLFGSLFVLLGMGMGSIHFSLGLYNLVRERLPTHNRRVIRLPNRGGSLFFHLPGERGDGLGLFYLGLIDGEPKFRLDLQERPQTRSLEAAGRLWEAGALLGLSQKVRLEIRTLDATQTSARIRVTTPLPMKYIGQWDSSGLEMGALLDLPDRQQQLLAWILRRGKASLADLAAHFGQEERVLQPVLSGLVAQGYLLPQGQGTSLRYTARLALKRGRALSPDIWRAFGFRETRAAETGRLQTFLSRMQEASLSQEVRFIIGILPVTGIFILVEWLIIRGSESFTVPLNFAGVITVSLLAGIFPVLLLATSRRRGDLRPDKATLWIGHPLLLTSIFGLNLGGILFYGLVIFQNPLQRITSLAAALLALTLTLHLVRKGAFRPRLVIELRQEENETGQARFLVSFKGEPRLAQVYLRYPQQEWTFQASLGEIPDFPSLQEAIFQVASLTAGELKIWVHRTHGSESVSLSAAIEVQNGLDLKSNCFQLLDGQAILPFQGETTRVSIQPSQSMSSL